MDSQVTTQRSRIDQAFAAQEESGLCALLLAAYKPMQLANELRADDFAEIATQLAQFHAVYWGRTQGLAKFSWLAKPSTQDLTNDTHYARETHTIVVLAGLYERRHN